MVVVVFVGNLTTLLSSAKGKGKDIPVTGHGGL
jgi:hypothetical protein